MRCPQGHQLLRDASAHRAWVCCDAPCCSAGWVDPNQPCWTCDHCDRDVCQRCVEEQEGQDADDEAEAEEPQKKKEKKKKKLRRRTIAKPDASVEWQAELRGSREGWARGFFPRPMNRRL